MDEWVEDEQYEWHILKVSKDCPVERLAKESMTMSDFMLPGLGLGSS